MLGPCFVLARVRDSTAVLEGTPCVDSFTVVCVLGCERGAPPHTLPQSKKYNFLAPAFESLCVLKHWIELTRALDCGVT